MQEQFSWIEMFGTIGKIIQKVDWKKFDRFFFNLQKIIENLPEFTKKIHTRLATRGWFLVGEFEAEKLFHILNVNDDELDSIMTEFTNDNLESIVFKIINEFPLRKHIIEQTIEAHKKGLYSLSVPVLLIQADGISSEILNGSFFSKKDNKPKTSESKYTVISDSIDQSSAEYNCRLLPLDILTSLNRNTYDMEEFEEGILNRHNVIHGHDIAYNNLINSSKGIVLLDYLADLNKYIKDSTN